MMKQLLLVTCTLSTFHVVICDAPFNKTADKPQTAVQKNQTQKPEDRDTAPIVVGALLHNILPNILNAAAASEMDDVPGTLQSMANALQGAGALFATLCRTIRKHPNLSVDDCLHEYFTSPQARSLFRRYYGFTTV